jgi:uncharacterized membrane-anchored protein YjiN (DUF445 family)
MENEEKVGTNNVTTNTGTTEVTETKKTLNELIEADKDLQSQFDKAKSDSIKTAIANERIKWEAEQTAKKEEADKLAKMDADQKMNYELEQWKARAEKAEKENSVSKLQSETIKQANEKGIPLEFITTINFEYETADTIATKLETLQKAVNKQRELVINEYSKESAPQTGDRVDTTPKSGYEKFLENQK